MAEILRDGGPADLEQLPGIGKSLARVIGDYVQTGRCRLLDRLTGEVTPEDLFGTVPGIGEELAHRIVTELGIDTLEELELAAHRGDLERVPGFGRRRVRGVREALAGILSRSTRRRVHERQSAKGEAPPVPKSPPVRTVLGVDAEYPRF